MGAFIDSLSDEDRTLVIRRSLGEKRPSYYSSNAANLSSTNDGMVQISDDMEALIILSSRTAIGYMLNFLDEAVNVSSSLNESDYLLFKEVVDTRSEGYVQIHSDVRAVIRDFENTRQGFQTTVRERSGSTAIDIPDLSKMYATLSESYEAISSPEELAVHGRISDAGFLYSVETSSLERVRELQSWSNVLRTYHSQ